MTTGPFGAFLGISSGLLLASLTLTGCSTETLKSTTAPSPAETAAPSATSVIEPEQSATPRSEFRAEKMDKSCSQILTSEGLYAINPNVTLDSSRTTPLSSVGALQMGAGGISCIAINATTKLQVNVVVCKLSTPGAAAKTAELTQSGLPSYISSPDRLGYFSTSDGMGTGQFIRDSYWVSVSSEDFTTPRNASQYSFLVSKNL